MYEHTHIAGGPPRFPGAFTPLAGEAGSRPGVYAGSAGPSIRLLSNRYGCVSRVYAAPARRRSPVNRADKMYGSPLVRPGVNAGPKPPSAGSPMNRAPYIDSLGSGFRGRRPCRSPSPGRCPGERKPAGSCIGPTGRQFDERLARWADNIVVLHQASQGGALGWANGAPSEQL